MDWLDDIGYRLLVAGDVIHLAFGYVHQKTQDHGTRHMVEFIGHKALQLNSLRSKFCMLTAPKFAFVWDDGRSDSAFEIRKT